MKALLLTPYVQNEMGIAFVRLPKDCKQFFQGRVLILPAPIEMEQEQSGLVDWQSGVLVEQMSPLVLDFLRNPVVREKIIRYADLRTFVTKIKRCQLRDGEYCHNELTVTDVNGGMVRSCWHHDTLVMKEQLDFNGVKQVAEQNVLQFMIKLIQQDLGHKRTLTLADIVLYAVKNQLGMLLTDTQLRAFFGLSARLENNKESSVRFDLESRPYLERLQQSVVELKFDDDPPAQYMRKPKPQYFRSAKWLRWVKAQPCVCCGKQADDPHHLIQQGQGIMGGKADDFAVIPLCRLHHDELHRSVEQFEREYGTQVELWYKFFLSAIQIGAIEGVA